MTSARAFVPPVAAPLPEILEERRPRPGLTGLALRHLSVTIGLVCLFVLLFIAICAPWLGTTDPLAINPGMRTRPPSWVHFFGTDALGRDLWSRVLYGTRVSLTVGFCVAALATVIGAILGMVSGYVRVADGIIMRLMDAVMSIPSILLAIALVALTRPSVLNVIIAITVAEVPRVARLVRSVVLTLREQAYVEAGIVSGSNASQIIHRHILPNALAPIIVQATYICASAMIIEATLSFIGAGTPASVPSWGNIMAEGRALWQVKPLIVLIPAAFLSMTVLAVNVVGDGLRDALDSRLIKDI
ncbi:ABC transporter permease [Mesorhizobium sp. ASY16-5R]|uniref:ABC transporter permease n=1 Tax=Mesorhizobium sp. ASY16-5R TaxID=3445772 RepID=UPI003FA0854F